MVALDSRAGKDTFVEFCQKHVTWCKNISTVDFVKQVANFCGWDGTKTPKNRAFLSVLKDLLTEWDDVPFRMVKKEAESFNSEALAYDFNTDEVLLIRRDAIETNEQSNHADAEVFNYDYDYIIENNGTLEELEQSAITFLHEICQGKDLIIH